jgi:hypothetical protein
MIKRLLNWFTGLLRPKAAGALGEVRLEILSEDGKTQVRHFQKAGPRGAARIEGICAVEAPEK